eukprot:9350098-Lingulodinium_polyedra.AAC.1
MRNAGERRTEHRTQQRCTTLGHCHSTQARTHVGTQDGTRVLTQLRCRRTGKCYARYSGRTPASATTPSP